MKDNKQITKIKRIRRTRLKIRKRLFRLESFLPRLSVFRSNKNIYAQIIDDRQGQTLASADSRAIKLPEKKTKAEMARAVGELLGQSALKKGVEEVVFDRGGYKFTGRVRALAEGARNAGLKF